MEMKWRDFDRLVGASEQDYGGEAELPGSETGGGLHPEKPLCVLREKTCCSVAAAAAESGITPKRLLVLLLLLILDSLLLFAF